MGPGGHTVIRGRAGHFPAHVVPKPLRDDPEERDQNRPLHPAGRLCVWGSTILSTPSQTPPRVPLCSPGRAR